MTLLGLPSTPANIVTAAADLTAGYLVKGAGSRTAAISGVAIDASNNLSAIGTLDTTGRITATLVTEQARLAYDGTHYAAFTVGATGILDITATDFVQLGSDLSLGAHNLGITGSIGETSKRVTKGWFTDLEVSNAIAGSITGNAATVTVAAEASDTTCSILFATDASGSLAPKTHAGLTFNAATAEICCGAVTSTGIASFTAAGTAKATVDFLTLTNTVNSADMDATGTGILFNQWYYDASTPASADAGRISVVAETDWTSTASSQDSAMVFSTAADGTVAERMRIASAGNLRVGSGVSLAARIHSVSTSEQLRLSYDASNHASFTVDASGDLNIAPTGASAANLGFWTSTFGTSANKVLGLASGTAPTTSPADAVQAYAADFNAAAGTAALHIRSEDSFTTVLGNNIGIFTSGAEVIDATARKNIFLTNGTAPSAHTDDGIYIGSLDCGSYDSADNLASLALCTESAVITASKAQDSALAVTINGHSYWLLLRACEVA